MTIVNGTISCPSNSGLCTTMDEAGAGFGVFLQYLVAALPTLLIILALVGGVIALLVAISAAIKGSVGKSFGHR